MPEANHSALGLGHLVRRATEVVGDGSVLWRLGSDARLRAQSSWHRDPDLRSRLARLLGDPPLEPWEGGWIRQVLAAGQPIWLERVEAETLYQCGLPADDDSTEVVLQAIDSQLALVIYRDRLSAPFTDKARTSLEELVARVKAGSGPVWGPEANVDLANASSALLWATDAQGLIVEANLALCRLLGMPRAQLLGLPQAELLAEPPRPRNSYLGPEPTECRLLGASGQELWVEMTSRPVFGADGQVSGAVHTAFDVDRRRRTEVSGRARRDSAQGLAALAEAMLDPKGLSSVEEAVVLTVAEQLGPSLVVLTRVARDLMEFTVLAQAGSLLGSVTTKDTRYPLPADSLLRAAIEGGVAVASGDLHDRAQGMRPGPLAQASGARSAVCAPVAEGRGALLALRQEPGEVSEQEIEFIEGAARLLALAWAADSGLNAPDSGPLAV
jgi:PAS domain S-box-containing protein